MKVPDKTILNVIMFVAMFDIDSTKLQDKLLT